MVIKSTNKRSYNDIFSMLKDHNKWFSESIPLIASENVPSPAVREALISDFGNRYAEGWPGERVYAGCTYIDKVEFECIKLAKKLFRAEFADVRPISGVVANLAIYSGFTNPGDIMLTANPQRSHITWKKRTLLQLQDRILISDIVNTSLGPKGMDKMLVDSLGDVTITNDGATILKEIDVQHPAAKMLVEIAKTTDNEVGDGTTSAVVLAGALLTNAESLITKNVHPTIIVDGYRKAAKKVKQYLQDISETVTANDKAILTKIAKTSMQTKLVRKDSDMLADIIVKAIISVSDKVADKFIVDIDDIKVEKKAGGSIC